MTDWVAATRTTAAALHELSAAAHNVDAAKGQGDAVVADADHELRAAVDAAREVGALWGEIGDALGIRRGNAYQRYRHQGRSTLRSRARPPLLTGEHSPHCGRPVAAVDGILPAPVPLTTAVTISTCWSSQNTHRVGGVV